MREQILWCALVALVIVAVSCVPLDGMFGVDSHGNVVQNPSPIIQTGGSIAHSVDTATGGIWGELALAALLVLQNGYILIRRVQAKVTASKDLAVAVAVEDERAKPPATA